VLLDNKNNGHVGNELRKNLLADSRLSVLSGLFSIYGYASLRKELHRLKGMRLLLSDWGDYQLQSLVGSEAALGLINKLDQKRIASECAKWLSGKVEVKALVDQGKVNQNLFHIENGEQSSFAIQGSSDFTANGLGYAKSDTYLMNMGISDNEGTHQLLNWFDNIWSDSNAVQDIKEDFRKKLEFIASDQSGKFIYFLTLYNIFKDLIEDIDEENIIKTKTGFKDTLVWNKLYKFQKDGVLGSIDKLEKYNGCIIADSVGLGKTFEALAVVKYYELRNDRVLVLCPKKLRDNWTMYTINDKRNLLAGDRFNYDVLNHTDLNRLSGLSGEINLATLNWGNYDLIVIDESHNFRNNNPSKGVKTRYRRLMEDIIQSGVKTKVLMLSATPVNNRMNDLKNQVAFITEARDDAFSDNGIKSIDSTLRYAQKQFNQWVKRPVDERTVASLLGNMSFGYFKLLDIVTIARSRKHIEKYYGTEEMGEFPHRLPPQNIKTDIDSLGDYPFLTEVNRDIRRLHLAAYSPLKYVSADKRDEYDRRYSMEVGEGKGIFKQIDREESLLHLMRINLLKRMESSISSFAVTVGRLLAQVDELLRKIEDHSSQEIEELSIEEVEIDSSELADLMAGNKIKVLIQDTDLIRWKQDLEEDKDLLEKLLKDSKKIIPDRDAKIEKLKLVLKEKISSPINSGNKKAIIFTAFSDTAFYLYENISEWVEKELGVHLAIITGGGGNKTTLSGVGSEFNNILTAFSPVSKERDKIDPEATSEIDILIATDCISEGQNLQDSDTLINYDIHWNPVRIIQRFGRIDRLGSKNTQIQLINFWPNLELDEYINLEARVSGRMVLLDISATGEENVIDENSQEMNDLEYRRKQLQQLQTAVVDLEDIAGGVSITDLTLNDFRMDLSDYMKENIQALEVAPNGFYAAVTLDNDLKAEGLRPGVIFCLKNIRNGKHAVQVDENYPLAPYFMVYVTDDAAVELNFTQSKKVLDLMKKQAFLSDELDIGAIEQVDTKTKHGVDMEHYQHLLAVAVDNIAGKSEEKGVQSLFTKGGTVLTATSSQGIEDFEVVTYLIITEAMGNEGVQ
jgi:superfamily II DNA or RNA helicase